MKRRLSRIDRRGVLSEIKYLLNKSYEEALKNNVEWARILAQHAFTLSERTNTRIPRSLKRLFCKKCKTPLIPGHTARVRLNSRGKTSYITVRCLYCGFIKRYRYK